jgi:hypothetical protein
MAEPVEGPLELPELTRLLTAVDAGVVLAPPRILRRVIKQDRRLTGIGLQVPHRKVYVIGREVLFQITSRDELELQANRGLPRTVILMARPEPERLAQLPRGQALVKYWRLLFHARVHQALEQRQADHRLNQAGVQERIQRIGQAEFDEIRAVLRQENFLLPPRDDAGVYVEFCALYLELRHFAPLLLPRYFPALGDRADVDQMVAQEVRSDQLFAATRLKGAPDSVAPAKSAAEPSDESALRPSPPRALVQTSAERHRVLSAKAQRAAARGNVVRAAILHQRAAAVAPPALVATTSSAARAKLDRLAGRLTMALQQTAAEEEAWRQALPALLEAAAGSIWPIEARLLYDLQKACIDHEREVYALELVEWFLTLGRRPIKRLLPNHRAVLMAKHCRKAAHRLATARLPDSDRQRLAALLHVAVEQSESCLRERLRPLMAAALERVGLVPHHLPERLARDKLIEELLDLTVERGFLTMGDLRDAVSRNNLKLPDLNGLPDFLAGDRLLRTNRRFATALDGVYRRGEIYLRLLQRLSSISFGTRLGRVVTRYVVLPYGVSFVALEGLLHMINPVARWAGHEEFEYDRSEMTIAVTVLGTLLFALFHIAGFRRQVARALESASWLLGKVFIQWPAAILRLPVVQAILASKPFALLRDWILKPLAITGCLSITFPLYGVSKGPALVTAGASFVFLSLFLNTRWGRTAEEIITDALVRTWLRFRIDIFPALFAFTMALFKELVEAVERFLYTVDEWLRFRSGEGRLTLVTKTALGFVWFFVTYIVRIYVNLFIEPTVNPIKHFPVVTVSAKLLLPLIPVLWPILVAPFLPFGHVFANAMASLNLALLPGIFGFLVWELKENWRLYEANRARVLRPVLIGHHGETLARYLNPGFHSGTIPKLYARLRRAERRAYRSGNWKSSRKYRESLHDAEERLRHFIEREFLPLLNNSKRMGSGPITAGRISIGSNRIGVELCCPGAPGSAWIAFEERSGWLVANVAHAGWLPGLAPDSWRAFHDALLGLYKMSGVDLIREQIEARLEPAVVTFDVLEQGLVVWPRTGFDSQALYPLRDGQELEPRILSGSFPVPLPRLNANQLLFSRTSISWSSWVSIWDADQAGKAAAALVPQELPLLAG